MIKKMLLALVVVLLASCSPEFDTSSDQEEVVFGQIGFDADGKSLSDQFLLKAGILFETSSVSPYSGQLEVYFSEGSLNRIASFKDGYLDGPWRGFHEESGELKGQGLYQNGQLHGQFSWFDEAGRLKGEGFYIDGKLTGKFVGYDARAEIVRKEMFVDGIKQGEYTLYHDNGVKKEQGTYENGEKTGVFERFNLEGRLKIKGFLVHGKPEGRQELFDEQGSLREISCYLNGAKTEVSACNADGREHCEAFLAMEEKSQTQLPKMIDQITELTSISVDCESNSITQNMTTFMGEAVLRDDWLVDKPRQLAEMHCNEKGLASVFGWTMVTRYSSSEGVEIAEVTTTPEDCFSIELLKS
jgi:antitoxin component YwqK of YwqJK toxin-antitoxin module